MVDSHLTEKGRHMFEQAAKMENIQPAADRNPALFTSPISATAIIALFLMLGVKLLMQM
jgi:hypothetical protein